MSKHKLLYTVEFTFSKRIPKLTQEIMTKDFMMLRNIACDELNPCYNAWNVEYDKLGIDVDDGDPLSEYGGSAYCMFIQRKQMEILNKINEKAFSNVIILDVDEVGDIFGRCMFDRNLTVHLCLKEFKGEL